MIETEDEFGQAFYRLLLGLGGRLDDETATLVLNWTYVGEEGLALDVCVGALRKDRTPVTDDELAGARALAWYLEWPADHFRWFEELPRVAAPAGPPWRFAAGPAAPDELERRAVRLAGGLPGVQALHRTVRTPAAGADGQPYRLLIAESAADADLLDVAGELTHRLDLVSHDRTGAAAIPVDAPPNPYYRSALAAAATLWSRNAG